jgi:hypothetical protein
LEEVVLVIQLFDVGGIPWRLQMQLGFKSWRVGSIFGIFV